ncbi:MAG TPA: tetratricopeptide repeat-containing sensor histidine kinase [Patescibacteria group bacterium]|nr:tetratricopeptide repeat-containing sensor histidine kinase [Patescibacteria group bacterium]
MTSPPQGSGKMVEALDNETTIDSTVSSVQLASDLNQKSEQIVRTNTRHSLELAEEAYRLADKVGFCAGMANALLNLGRANRFLTHFDDALGYLERALKLFKEINDLGGIANTLNNTGHIYNSTGRSQDALNLHLRALYLSRETGDILLEANSLVFIGNVHFNMGNHSEALKSHHDAYELYKYINDEPGQSFALNNIGNAHHSAGNYAKALEYYLKSFSLKEHSGDSRAKATAYHNIGSIYYQLGDFKNALQYFDNYLSMQRSLGDSQGEAVALSHIGSVYVQLWQYDMALEKIQASLKIAEAIGDKRQTALCLSDIGRVQLELGELDSAYNMLMTSIQLITEIGDNGQKADILSSVARLFVKREDAEKGIPFAKEALQIAEQQQKKPQIFEAHQLLAELYKLRGDFKKSLLHFELFHNIKNEVFNDETTRRMKILEISFNLENTRKEAEIYRLKNVELADLNERLTLLVEERNDLLAIVAHDLKNPLAGISLASAMLEKYHISMSLSEIRQQAQNITRTAARMSGIIARLLEARATDMDAAKITLQRTDISIVAHTVIEDFRNRAAVKNISLAFNNCPGCFINGDENTLRLVFDNLLSNAIKFSPLGKKVTLELQKKDKTIRALVKDEGPGISEDDKQKLFLKFARLSAQPTGGEDSTGLGLSIVKKFIEAMNGKVWCESTEGHGATFIIEFPAVE